MLKTNKQTKQYSTRALFTSYRVLETQTSPFSEGCDPFLCVLVFALLTPRNQKAQMCMSGLLAMYSVLRAF